MIVVVGRGCSSFETVDGLVRAKVRLQLANFFVVAISVRAKHVAFAKSYDPEGSAHEGAWRGVEEIVAVAREEGCGRDNAVYYSR